LARDILTWLKERRLDLFDRLEYWILEPSDRRQDWQKRTLSAFSGKVRWAKAMADVADGSQSPPGAPILTGVQGIIFCNELLDAMPVHRWCWEAKGQRWLELGVSMENGKFVWKHLDPAAGDPRDPEPTATNFLPPQSLPHRYEIEVCPAAVKWWQQAAAALASGKLVAIDYGLTAEELFIPERNMGTLRGYRSHQVSREILETPGEQDITAQVNFTALEKAGEKLGLRTEVLESQERFLTRIAAQLFDEKDASREWTPARARQFHTLTHPDHLGRAFRVLVQSRGGLAR
jgi:SAM-dependent MidA family methyltransferase